MHSKRDEATMIDTLVIIGNGFDIWQQLRTSYWQFRSYYIEHRERIMNELLIPALDYFENGKSKQVTPVELVYGNPFEANELGDEFWNVFEASMGRIDAQLLNLFFDKEENDLAWMEETVENARRILVKAFNDWIDTIDTKANETFYEFMREHDLKAFEFGDNCFFVNFNYTNTLEVRFNIDEDRVFHVHGQCYADDEVIFGHADHPQQPQHELQQYGGRFSGLYHIENMLYQTDKHVQNQIMELKFALALEGVDAESIKHIYVLGHSFGEADLEYFDFLISKTTVKRGNSYKDYFKNRIYYDEREWNEKKLKRMLKHNDTLDELNKRLQYTVKQYGYRVSNKGYQNYGYGYQDDIQPDEIAAIRERYGIEQTITNMEMENEFIRMMENELANSGALGSAHKDISTRNPFKRRYRKPVKSQYRSVDAMWHISCFSQRDVEWVQKIMPGLGCNNFEVLRTVDDCLKLISSN